MLKPALQFSKPANPEARALPPRKFLDSVRKGAVVTALSAVTGSVTYLATAGLGLKNLLPDLSIPAGLSTVAENPVVQGVTNLGAGAAMALGGSFGLFLLLAAIPGSSSGYKWADGVAEVILGAAAGLGGGFLAAQAGCPPWMAVPLGTAAMSTMLSVTNKN